MSFGLFRSLRFCDFWVNLNEWHWNTPVNKKLQLDFFNDITRIKENPFLTLHFIFSIRFRCSVLVFPPLNSYRRFLIHKLCDKFPTLGTFSISEGIDRRVVIYSRINIQCNLKTSNPEERWDFPFVFFYMISRIIFFREVNLNRTIFLSHFLWFLRLCFNRHTKQTKTESQSRNKVSSSTMGIKDLDALAKTIKRKNNH